jgi:UDP-glucose 4-epimerase
MFENNYFDKKKILVTGGVGFIGSNLAIRLVELGADVTLVDSLIPEYGGNLENIRTIKNNVKLNISDVRDNYSMKYLIRNKDILFNLAGQTSHLNSMIDPFTDLEINCTSQLSILEACKNYNPEIKIVFASTRQIYGKAEYLPVNEQHILKPVDVNGINKMAGEWYHILYNKVYGIKTCSLRLTNTYGPRMRIKDANQTFLGIWIKSVIENKTFEVWGGNQIRDYTYVDDAVDAFLIAASNSNADGEIFNLGGPQIYNLLETARILVNINGSGNFTIKEFPKERAQIDIGDYYSDYTLIQNKLGWKPLIDLKEGFNKTISYFRGSLNEYI